MGFPEQTARVGDNRGDADASYLASARCGPLVSLVAVHGSIMALPPRAVHRTMVRVVGRFATRNTATTAPRMWGDKPRLFM